MTDPAYIHRALGVQCLRVLGTFDEDQATTAMIGPDEPAGFWAHFRNSAEGQDGAPDPIDRWSARVLTKIAADLGAAPYFPFGGPPYHPFFTWALRTGRIHASPVRLLVHTDAGLWVSFRGALRFPFLIDFAQDASNPCDTCAEKPCLTACPIGALDGAGYDVPACKDYLRQNPTCDCMTMGCRVRAACPVSKSWGRDPAQSAFHMDAFVPR